jgi:hypothetical protein
VDGVATLADVDEIALALPEMTSARDGEGRPSWSVRDKVVCWHREPRPDAVDPETGERLDDVVVFRVPDLEMKDVLLADDRGIYFTTPHWNRYPAVLVRMAGLARLDRAEVEDLIVEAWLARAPKRVAKAWLAARGDEPA